MLVRALFLVGHPPVAPMGSPCITSCVFLGDKHCGVVFKEILEAVRKTRRAWNPVMAQTSLPAMLPNFCPPIGRLSRLSSGPMRCSS